jgi:hypothetical protein
MRPIDPFPPNLFFSLGNVIRNRSQLTFLTRTKEDDSTRRVGRVCT